MYCTKCGTQLPEEAQFCSNCGTKVMGYNHEAIKDSIHPVTDVKSKKKMIVLCGALLAVICLIVLVFVIINRSPIAGKWYDMNDDDYWLDIGNKTITIRDVFTDEVYGTIEYSYSKDSRKIITGTIENGSKSRRFVEEVADTLSQKEIYVEDSILCVMGLDGRKKVVKQKFSSDSSYKRDH